MNTKPILGGALTGFVSAFLVDLDAWKRAPKGSKFEWDLAAKRWLAGAVAGALAGLGLGSV